MYQVQGLVLLLIGFMGASAPISVIICGLLGVITEMVPKYIVVHIYKPNGRFRPRFDDNISVAHCYEPGADHTRFCGHDEQCRGVYGEATIVLPLSED